MLFYNSYLAKKLSHPRVIISSLALILITNILILSQNIGSSFFYDEAVYINLAWHPLQSDFYLDPIFYRHPPLYPSILFIFGQIFGYSELSMRIPSILFSCLSLILIFKVSVEFKKPWAGLLTCLLLVNSSLFQQYSQAATMYSLNACLFSLFCFALIKKNLRLILLSYVALVYTHFFSFLLAPILIFYFYKSPEQRKFIWKFLFFLTLFISPLLPLFFIGSLFHSSNTHYFSSYTWIRHLSIFKNQFFLIMLIALPITAIQLWIKSEKSKTLLTLGLLLFLLIPNHQTFSRYWYPYLSLFFLIGSLGLVQIFEHAFKKPILLIPLVALSLLHRPNSYIREEKDIIQHEEWKTISKIIPNQDSVLVNNARSYLYYKMLNNDLKFKYVTQGCCQSEIIKKLLNVACFDWLIYQKLNSLEKVHQLIQEDKNYALFKELDHTLIYKNNHECIE